MHIYTRAKFDILLEYTYDSIEITYSQRYEPAI